MIHNGTRNWVTMIKKNVELYHKSASNFYEETWIISYK